MSFGPVARNNTTSVYGVDLALIGKPPKVTICMER